MTVTDHTISPRNAAHDNILAVFQDEMAPADKGDLGTCDSEPQNTCKYLSDLLSPEKMLQEDD